MGTYEDQPLLMCKYLEDLPHLLEQYLLYQELDEDQWYEILSYLMFNNEEFFNMLRKQSHFIIRVATRRLIKDVGDVIKHEYALRDLDVQTEELCIISVKAHGDSLRHVQKPTAEICRWAVQRNPDALKYVDQSCTKMTKEETEEICILAIKVNYFALEYLTGRMVEDKEQYFKFCKIAVQTNGYAMKYIDQSSEGRLTTEQLYELCKIAVEEDGTSLKYIDQSCRRLNKEQMQDICTIALEQGYRVVIPYVEGPIKDDPEIYSLFCKRAVRKDGETLRLIEDRYVTNEIIKLAGKQIFHKVEM